MNFYNHYAWKCQKSNKSNLHNLHMDCPLVEEALQLNYDPDYLQKEYPVIEFDPYVVFEENTKLQIHDYYVDGRKWEGSTTRYIHSFFNEFDADKTIQGMRLSKSWGPKHKYWGMTDCQIKEKWEDVNKDAAPLGHAMHARIEKFYNIPALFTWQKPNDELLLAYYTKEEIERTEFQQFLQYHTEWPSFRKWRPFRTELRVFDRLLEIPGSIDMLYWSPRSTKEHPLLILVDWKRSKEIKTKSFFNQKDKRFITGKGACADLLDCNYIHYSLQLNMYAALIERNSPYRIEEMYLAVFHPTAPSYKVFAVSRYFEVIFPMLQLRLNEVAAIREKKNNAIANTMYNPVLAGDVDITDVM